MQRKCIATIDSLVTAVGKSSTASQAESFAVILATSRKGSVIVMPREQFEREKMYQTTMCLFRSMLKKGIITKEDYEKAEGLMRKKYSPVVGTLFSDLTLT